MRGSFISMIQVKNKWQIVKQDLINLTTTPIPNEDYDDKHTAKIAGLILAKMWKLSFIEMTPDITLEEKKRILRNG